MWIESYSQGMDQPFWKNKVTLTGHVVWEKPSKARCVDEAKTSPDVQPTGDAQVVRGNSGSRVVDSAGAGGGHQRQDGGGAGDA